MTLARYVCTYECMLLLLKAVFIITGNVTLLAKNGHLALIWFFMLAAALCFQSVSQWWCHPAISSKNTTKLFSVDVEILPRD